MPQLSADEDVVRGPARSPEELRTRAIGLRLTPEGIVMTTVEIARIGSRRRWMGLY
jgi:hypothetical protein